MEAVANVMAQDIMEDERNVSILQLQNEVLEKIAAVQASVRDAVINREWADFESLLSTMNQYSDQFQALETERATLLTGLGEEAADLPPRGTNETAPGFYRLVSRLPEQDRNGLTEMYRNLKLRALKVRLANESLVAYLNEAKTTISSFMDAAYPERKTRFYSRWGTKVSADARSMVVNHSL
ncbi:MAG: flagellar export chaperone FlgN [Treponema sp.]|jgi:hypothetical protein|nr:flagellar export chaperone FlgN [Treponema sp.]